MQLQVTDTGVGMDEETQRRIFEPFFTTKDKGRGTGLGLATVYGVMSQAGGSIHVYSEPDYGTTFHAYFPAVEPSSAAEPRRGAIEAPPVGDETILLVEDEQLLRDLLARALRAFGYTVLAAGDGEQAVACFERQGSEIDLVVMDLIMPRLSGRQAATRMIAARPNLKLVLMTGYAPEGDQTTDLLVPGQVVLLQKPFVASDLGAQIRALLDAGARLPRP